MYLGIDYGKKRIGLALGEQYPKPLLVLDNFGREENVQKIADICESHEVKKIIIGMPEDRGSDSQKLIVEINEFASDLSSLTSFAEMIFEPEAYTSTEAEELLKDHKKYDRNDKGKVDAMAATLLLEQYINRQEKP